MTSRERPPISSLRAIREVEPTPELAQYLAGVALASKECFGVSFRQVNSPNTLMEQLEDGDVSYMDGIQELKAAPFGIDKLRVTLFERRALASRELNDAVSAAHARMNKNQIRSGRPRKSPTGRQMPNTRENPLPGDLERAQVKAGLLEGILVAATTGVVMTPRQEITGIRFFASQIDPGSRAAGAITNQASVINKAARDVQALKRLTSGVYDFETEPDILSIPVMIVPDASTESINKFLEIMNTRPSPDLLLREVRWDAPTETPGKHN